MEINITLVFQLVVFLLLLAGLSQFLFSPLLRLFAEREKRIEGARKEAERMQIEAEKRLKEVETRIQKAQEEARQKMQEMKLQGIEFQRQLIEKSRKEATEQLNSAKKQLSLEVEKVRLALKTEEGVLANWAVDKVTQQDSPGQGSAVSSKWEFSNA